jgi:hypothetical protein
MNTSLKVIMTAIGIAVLASPVMAQEGTNSRPVPARVVNAHGSVSQARAHRAASAEAVAEGSHIHVEDCIRTAFPQCGGN